MPARRCVGGLSKEAEALADVAKGAAVGLALLVGGCADEAAPPPAEPKPELKFERQVPAKGPAPAAAPAPDQPTGPDQPTSPDQPTADLEADDAANVLRRYYRLIEERRFPDALKLREPDGVEADAFAAHFEGYASHGATVGRQSEPVQAGSWLYVEVPVQTYGSMKDGTPFGSVGTVTLRRPKAGGEWRIFTRG